MSHQTLSDAQYRVSLLGVEKTLYELRAEQSDADVKQQLQHATDRILAFKPKEYSKPLATTLLKIIDHHLSVSVLMDETNVYFNLRVLRLQSDIKIMLDFLYGRAGVAA